MLPCASQRKPLHIGTDFSSPYIVVVCNTRGSWNQATDQFSPVLLQCKDRRKKKRKKKENPACRKWLLFVTRLGKKENNTERKFQDENKT